MHLNGLFAVFVSGPQVSCLMFVFVFDSGLSPEWQCMESLCLQDCFAVADVVVDCGVIVVEVYSCVCDVLLCCGDSCFLFGHFAV